MRGRYSGQGVKVTFNYRGCIVNYFADGSCNWAHAQFTGDPDDIETNLVSDQNPYADSSGATMRQVMAEIDNRYNDLDIAAREVAEIEAQGVGFETKEGFDNYVNIRAAEIAAEYAVADGDPLRKGR